MIISKIVSYICGVNSLSVFFKTNVVWGIERSVFSVIGENSRNALKIKWFSCA